MTKETIILGVDPGTCITGYALIKENLGEIIPVDFGCIRPPSRFTLHERYLIIYNALHEIIEQHKPKALAIENQFIHKNAQSALKLGMAKGISMITALKAGIPVYEYAPKEAKLAVTGSGSASKEKVQQMLKLVLKLPSVPTPEDAADALALAICHLKREKNSKLFKTRGDYVRLS